MNLGDTFLGLDVHLWMLLTSENPDGQVVIANLTTHDLEKHWCSGRCVIVRPEEHPYPSHDSCVHYRDASLTSAEMLRRGVENGTYTVREPLSPRLLARIRQGALDSPLTDKHVKAEMQAA